jgi:hypothetical protein
MNASQKAAACQANMPPACKSFGICIPDAKGLSFEESKGMSHIAYDGEIGDVYEIGGEKWIVSELEADSVTGFRAVLLKPLDSTDDRIIAAFAGTEFTSLADWETNFGQPFKIEIPPQYRQAAEFAKRMKEYAKETGSEFILTGHSLGGGLASYASAMNGCIPSTAINAAPLDGMTLYKALKTGCRNTTHYNADFEIVHNLPGIQLGNEHISVPGGYGWFLPIINHFGNHSLEATAPCVPLPKQIPVFKATS